MSQRRPVVGRVESVVGGSSRLSNMRWSGRPDTSRHRHWRDRRGGTGRLSILPEPVRPARGNFVTERPHIYQNSFSDICRPVSLQLRFRNSKIGRVLIIVPISAYLFMNYKPSPIKIFHTQYLPNWNSLINQKEISTFSGIIKTLLIFEFQNNRSRDSGLKFSEKNLYKVDIIRCHSLLLRN